jgi:hypothetical protein
MERGNQRVWKLYFALALVQAAHSVEEMLTHLYEFMWIVTGKLHAIFSWYPQFRMGADVFGALNMLLIALVLGAVPLVRARRRGALFFAAIVAIVEIINGVNHITAAIYFRSYAPGTITAPFLIVFGAGLLHELRREKVLQLRPVTVASAGRSN